MNINQIIKGRFPIILFLVLISFCLASCSGGSKSKNEISGLVNIQGYNGHAMEPFIDRNGKYLFFNSLNDSIDTSLYYAVKQDDNNFQLIGKINGVNKAPPHLDAVGSMDINNNFYFISTRNYPNDYKNVYKGLFVNGMVNEINPVEGDFYIQQPGWIIMDAEISPDGNSLYYVNARFAGNQWPEEADIRIAHLIDGKFMKDGNSDNIMKNINTGKGLEYAPSIIDDGLELYFTRLNSVTSLPQIYVARRKTKLEAFGQPELVGLDGFVEAPSISYDKTKLYFHKKVNGIHKIYKVSM